MATKKKGRGPVVDLTLDVLKDIRAEARKTNERLGGMDERIGGMHGTLVEHGQKLDLLASISLQLVDRVSDLEQQTIRGFTAVRGELDGVNQRLDLTNARLENLRDLAGARVRDHDDRLESLEGRVSKLEARG